MCYCMPGECFSAIGRNRDVESSDTRSQATGESVKREDLTGFCSAFSNAKFLKGIMLISYQENTNQAMKICTSLN